MVWRNCSVVMSLRATPTIANSCDSMPLFARLYSAGISLRAVRSPLAPKMTMMHGPVCRTTVVRSAGDVRLSSFSRGMGWTVSCVDNVFRVDAECLFFQLDVPAKLLAHGAQKLFGKGMVLARAEARIQSRRQHIDGNRRIERGLDRPAAFAGILDLAGVFRKVRVLGQRHRCKIEQPRRDHAAATPHLGDIGQVKVVAVFRS